MSFEYYDGTGWQQFANQKLIATGEGDHTQIMVTDSWQDRTHAGDSRLSGQAGEYINNVKFIDPLEFDNGSGVQDLNDTNLTATECTVRVVFRSSYSKALTNVRLFAYDGVTTTTPADGLQIEAYEQGEANTSWTRINDSTLGTGGRARVFVDGDNDIVTSSGDPIRGESVFLTDPAGTTTGDFTLDELYDEANQWKVLRDSFKLNAIRFYISRTPQHFGGGPGADCGPDDDPAYRCYDFDYILDSPLEAFHVIEDVVNIAARLGMYLIIDNHPVGGYNTTDMDIFWDAIGPRYKNRTHVLYEVANEPVQWTASAYGASDVQMEEDYFTSLRAAAPDTHIILWSFANATGSMDDKIDEGTDIDYSNASVGWHHYGYDATEVTNLHTLYPTLVTEGTSTTAVTAINETRGISWFWLNGAIITGRNGGFFNPGDVTWSADSNAVNMTNALGGSGYGMAMADGSGTEVIYYVALSVLAKSAGDRPFSLGFSATVN